MFYFRDCHEDGVEYQREDETADTLNEVGGNAGKGACTVHKVFADEIPPGNENDVQDSPCGYTEIAGFLCFSQFLVDQGRGKSHQSLYDKGNRDIHEISAQKV